MRIYVVHEDIETGSYNTGIFPDIRTLNQVMLASVAPEIITDELGAFNLQCVFVPSEDPMFFAYQSTVQTGLYLTPMHLNWRRGGVNSGISTTSMAAIGEFFRAGLLPQAQISFSTYKRLPLQVYTEEDEGITTELVCGDFWKYSVHV